MSFLVLASSPQLHGPGGDLFLRNRTPLIPKLTMSIRCGKCGCARRGSHSICTILTTLLAATFLLRP
eukprot:11901539-Heterocapsa_arctica.AAC.1